METQIKTITIKAQSADNIKKKMDVIQNILAKLDDKVICDVIYPKVKKDPDFFKKLGNSPILKML